MANLHGSIDPVAWQNPLHPDQLSSKPIPNWMPLYTAAPVAQQPQARPDFTDEWTGYLKDGETPFERFLRERKDLDALTKLYQRALEENERLKAQQPQAEAVPSGYAGVMVWLGDRKVVRIVTEPQIRHEREPGFVLRHDALQAVAAIAQQKGQS